MKTPTKQTSHRLAAVLAIATAFATTGVCAATTTYYQIAGTSDETCLIANDGLSFDEEITHTSKLAFPGITLDDIPVGASFFSRMWGDWSQLPSTKDAAKTAVGFCEQRCDSNNDGKIDKIALQVCTHSGGNLTGVVIVLTNGADGDGVYVQRYGRTGKSGSEYTTPYFTLASNGDISWTSSARSTSTDDAHYRLQGLSIHGMSPVNTEPWLAFRGVTLEEIKDSQFMSGFQFGTWMTAATVSNVAAFVSTWSDGNGELKKIVMQFRAPGDATAVIELTDGTGGVYAQQVLGVSDVSSANTQVFAINAETGAITKAAGTDRGADKYGIHDFVIQYPPCVKKTPNKIKVWSSGDSENPLTLDDIAEGTFTARFSGATGKDLGFLDVPNSATGYFKKIRTDDIVVEFQVQNGDYDCCVVVSFTNGVDGIYAEVIDAKNKKDETAGNYEFYKADGTFNSCNNSTVAETWNANYYGVCDLRVTVPTVHNWTLDADTTWGALRGGETVEADEVVKITVADPTAVLTVNENVTAAKIEFVGVNCAKLAINSGYTVTAENISGVTDILNNGSLVKAGDGTVSWPFDNASTGTTTVSNGTLRVASQTGSGTSHTVRVKDGATFDLNCVWQTAVAVVLEGGANFANTGSSDAAWSSSINIRSLTLEGDATVTATRTFGLRTTSHGANTLNLGTYTLTINAASGKSFFVDNTTINGTGKILVASGTLFSYNDSHGDAYTLEVGAGGTLAGGGNNGITCGDFVNHGSINSSNNKLIVKGTLTPGNSLIFLTLANGATIKASATQAQTVSTAFSVSGTGDKTITVDASDITKDKLGAGNVAVLTVPSSFNTSSVTWAVSGEQIAGTRAKWRTDGTTQTLYLCKPIGLMVIFR